MSPRRLAAVMFTDIEGFTEATQKDELGAIGLVEEQEALAASAVAAHAGRKIKSTGDGMLVEFPNARDALKCAVALLQGVQDRNRKHPQNPIKLRVGIHLGDVESRGDDILGDTVNISSRIEALAAPGTVCISEQVYDQVRNKVAVHFEPLGSRTLKGISESVKIYRVDVPLVPAGEFGRSASEPRLAVLPLTNISPDPKDEYFADGLTEELIATLSGIRSLRVISRTSVGRYKGTDKSIAQIGAELGVASILEGSVRKGGDRVRITVQLIDVPTDEHRWSQTFDRTLDDIFKLQSEIAQRVAELLRVEIRPTDYDRLTSRPAVRDDSYLAYLRGRAGLQGRSREALRTAKCEFEEAIRLDPANARAYSGLSDVTRLLWDYYKEGGPASLDQALALIQKALEIDPNLSEAHASLGEIHRKRLEFVDAERELQLAISLNPSYHTAHHWYALLLEDKGNVARATEQLELASQLDPFSSITTFGQAQLLFWSNRIEEAEAKLERMADVDGKGAFYHDLRADICEQRGDKAEAIRELEEAARVSEDSDYRLAVEGIKSALRGEIGPARGILERLAREFAEDPFSWLTLAYLSAWLQDNDDFFKWLLKSVEARHFEARFYRLDPVFESMRRDPRFGQLLSRLNLD